MTFNNKEMSGCSARGIALRDTKEGLEARKERICNVRIEENLAHTDTKTR